MIDMVKWNHIISIFTSKTTFMRVIVIGVISILFLFSCKSGSDNSSEQKNVSGIETYVFEVESLQDSLLVDTLSKMIFTTPGIEQMLIRKIEKQIIIQAHVDEVSEDELKQELVDRGAIIN